MVFDDEYPTCKETYATLRVFSQTLMAADITDVLGLLPSESFSKGEAYGNQQLVRRETGWLLTSRESVNSRDTKRHVAWVVEKLMFKGESMQALKKLEAEVDVSCYYLSIGQGGPSISAELMLELGKLEIDVWWDVYFDSSAEEH